jgi:hypothetical protein
MMKVDISLDTEEIELLYELYMHQINQTSYRSSDKENRILRVLKENYVISKESSYEPLVTSAGIAMLAKAGKTATVFDILQEIFQNLHGVDKFKEISGDEVRKLVSDDYNVIERQLAFQLAFDKNILSGIFFLGGGPPWQLTIEKKADKYIESPDRIHELYKEYTNEINEDLIFVIMAIRSDMDPIFDGIQSVATEMGFNAIRVDKVLGDYKITDKIIEFIHNARFIIADLTHERPNVYFELGYARGIGKTVITTARKGTELHFDVKDWTCIFYDDSKTLEKQLRVRIDAEIKNEKKKIQVIPQRSETEVSNIPNLSIIEAKIDDYYRIDDANTVCRPSIIFQHFKGQISLLIRFYNKLSENTSTSFTLNDAKIMSSGFEYPLVEIAGGRDEFPVTKGHMVKRIIFEIPAGIQFFFEGNLVISGTYFMDGKKQTLDQAIPLEITEKKKSELTK